MRNAKQDVGHDMQEVRLEARMLTMDEVAAALAVHRNTDTAMMQAGTIRAIRTGRTWKIPLSALDEYIAGRDTP